MSGATFGPSSFLTPGTLLTMAPADPEWVWRGYVARGALTLLSGAPKVGKSTLAWALANAAGGGEDEFLGSRVGPCGFVYVTEESAVTVRLKIRADTNARILPRESAWPVPAWDELVRTATEECRASGAGLLVIDTFSHWAGLADDHENDAGPVQAAMRHVVGATNAGLAVVLVVHRRKAGGRNGLGIRGSSALAGTADAIVTLDRDGDVCGRMLEVESRWESPAARRVERDPAGNWHVADRPSRPGPARSAVADIESDVNRVVDVIREHPGCGSRELRRLMGGVGTDRLKAAVTAAIEQGRIRNEGTARSCRYVALGGVSPATPPEGGQVSDTLPDPSVSHEVSAPRAKTSPYDPNGEFS